MTCNSTWFTVKAITDHTIPINQGCYRPVEIICPEGTVLNCTYPASVVSGVTETSPRIIDMLLKTLAPAIPNGWWRRATTRHAPASSVARIPMSGG